MSELVLEETAAGDPAMAAARHAVLAGLPQLAQTPEVDALAVRILEQGIIPPKAAPDAEHIALAAVHAMNYLLQAHRQRFAPPTGGSGVRRGGAGLSNHLHTAQSDCNLTS